VHVPYGTVSLGGAKLATRTGNVVLLKDLFAEAIEKVKRITEEKNSAAAGNDEVTEAVGVGAVIFYYLSGSRIHDINFSLTDALSFDGNTGPYAQYTYARTCSVLEKVNEEGEMTSAPLSEVEFELAKCLSVFPERVASAVSEYEPSIVTRYILDLCAAFNRFYHECSIANCEDSALRSSRIALTRATRQVLGTALHLICMQSPEKI
jgi:arginyl-tRNA synthetase